MVYKPPVWKSVEITNIASEQVMWYHAYISIDDGVYIAS